MSTLVASFLAFPQSIVAWMPAAIMSVDISSDGRLIAFGTSAGEVYVIEEWKQRLVGRHADTIMHVRFSPDGELLASCSHDGTVKLWDISTNTLLKEFFV